MAKRPILDKQVARLRKALRPGTDTFIDLTEWLVDRRYAKNRKRATQMLLDGRVMVGSHRVGRFEIHDPIGGDENDKRFVPQPLIRAKHRSEIVVLDEAAA